jgi:hypothetical protein
MINEETYPASKAEHRNNSQLSYVDCCMRLYDESRPFEEMSDDDLDSIYAIAFNRWAYHLTRQAYIDALNAERTKRNSR